MTRILRYEHPGQWLHIDVIYEKLHGHKPAIEDIYFILTSDPGRFEHLQADHHHFFRAARH